MRKQFLLLFFIFIATFSVNAQVLPLREQARVIDEILIERLDSLLPSLMEKNDIDMWVIISREYNEDPV